ncbi:multiple sugar transport system substrate-binding protein [Evansella vedderi]|uniref:Multiple sugar transport system substrate-binding protein n=1 Tax=Evansella vedderi TaxID=38282 RepID=A0ABT9ZSB7_9BACI|nr:extracellular solute-binding protein [Evansella vedderi]MDQ0254114.1 multiple sugar transport system substrate-binding protein [Evansella vedderi]
MKRLNSLMVLLVAMFVFLTIAGCSGGDEESNAGSGDGGDGTNDGEVVTIKWYNWDNDVMGATTQKYIEEFEKENPNIKVESVPLVPGDSLASLQNLDILLSSGEEVDVISFPNADSLYQRAELGALASLNDFYEEEGIDPTEVYYVNPSVGDDYYGIQFNATTNFVLLNKDALDEAGLEVPKIGWTWDDFAEYAEKLTVEKDGKKMHGAYFHSWSLYMNPIAQTLMKHPFLFEDGTTNFSDPSFKKMFEMRKELEEKGYAKSYSDVLGAELGYRSEFFNESAAMLLTGSWMIGEAGDTEINPHDFTTAFAPVPVLNEGDEFAAFMGGNFLAIGNSSTKKEESYKFARFVSENLSEGRVELPGLKQGDARPVVERIIEGNEELIDVESLMYTLFDEEVNYLDASQVSIGYGRELESILSDGFAKYMLNDESIDEVIDWMIEEATKVIDKNS